MRQTGMVAQSMTGGNFGLISDPTTALAPACRDRLNGMESSPTSIVLPDGKMI
jgi:hypothetical protein